MEISYGAKTMQESVTNIYERINKVLSVHCKLNKLAMTATQSLGYNGFKRWHRCRSRKFFELKICLANELYDKFRIVANFKDYEVNYAPASIEEHLKSWESAILEAIEELGTINKDYFELTGISCGMVECAMCKMVRDYEKIGRLIKRFTESDWLTLDMHIVDDKLHKKYKCKEEGSGEKWIHGTMQMKY